MISPALRHLTRNNCSFLKRDISRHQPRESMLQLSGKVALCVLLATLCVTQLTQSVQASRLKAAPMRMRIEPGDMPEGDFDAEERATELMKRVIAKRPFCNWYGCSNDK
uniref:Gla domain-containing protein n=1 Tax=Macrostomum lignano TaxID=282301 RepID=A0A1I8GIS8_9PLAT